MTRCCRSCARWRPRGLSTLRVCHLSIQPLRPNAPLQSSAWSLLEHYTTIADMETNKLASSLQQSLGAHRTDGASFVFLLHDRHRHRVIAARNGDSELSWGCGSNSLRPPRLPRLLLLKMLTW